MKKFKTLNNWVARAFVTEYFNGNLKACVCLYSNCYRLLDKICWKRLLVIFFSDFESLTDLRKCLNDKHEHFLLLNLEQMYSDFYGVDY